MKTESVKIKGNVYTLSGTLIKPESKEKVPAVVFYHGMVSQSKPRSIERAEQLAKKGISSLCFDFRGCGESEGKLYKTTLKDWLEDALIATNFMISENFVDKNRIGLCGKSFGGYMAALVSEKMNVKSIILQAPAVYEDKEFEIVHLTDENKIRRINYRKSNNILDNKAIRAIAKYKNSLLVVGSELDDVCPKTGVEGYFEKSGSQNKKLEWLKGADHALSDKKSNQKFTDTMVDWFKKTL